MRHVISICDGCGRAVEHSLTDKWVRFQDADTDMWDMPRQFCSIRCVHTGTGMNKQERQKFRMRVSEYLDGLPRFLTMKELAE